MKGFSLFALIFCLVLLVSGIYYIAFSHHIYLGKETFYSNQEYVEFKEAMASPNVTINDIESLTSDMPIVVSFSVNVPRGETFPYGHKSSGNSPLGYTFMGVGAFGIALVIWETIGKRKTTTD